MRDIINEKSFSYGDEIKLSSGLVSRLYFDMKPTMLDAEASYLIAKEILALLSDDVDFVGGLEMGAVPIVAALCPVSFLEKRPVSAFFIRKKAKKHGVRKLIEGIGRDVNLAGKNVVLVDDVTTTGKSMISALDAVVAAGGEISQVISIVDREEGAVELFASYGINFTPILRARDFIPSP